MLSTFHPSAFCVNALDSTYEHIVVLKYIVSLLPTVFGVQQTASLFPFLPECFEECFYDTKDDYFGYSDHFFDIFSHEMGGDCPDTDSVTDCFSSIGSDADFNFYLAKNGVE